MSYLHFFSALTDTIVSLAVNGGYIALFMLMVLEGIPLIGIAIPGHVAIISAGFLAGTGVLSPWLVLVIGTAGAAIGDYISYLLGRRFGWPLIERLRPFFFIPESALTKARAALERHSSKALVIGRFNPVTRGLIPFFVGANKANPRHFWTWNMVGTFLWVASSVIAGYALALGFHAAQGMVSRVVLIGIVIAILIVWGYRFVNARFHIFKRYELFVLGLNIASLFVFFRMIEDVYSSSSFLASFDLWVNGLMVGLVSHAHSFLLGVAAWTSALGGYAMMTALAIIGGIILASHRRWRSSLIMICSIGSTAFMTGWFKDLVGRIRPEDYFVPHINSPIRFLFDSPNIFSDPSFPSAHASFAAAFLLSLAYLVVPRMKHWISRELFILAAFLLAVAIGLSRIVLSVHWATDVIAGWSLGVFCATASILFIKYVGTLLVGKAQ